jgi:glycosyltransferase involved in cell wall biosynthesis
MQYIFFISEEIPTKYPKIDDNYTWHPIHKKTSFEEFSELWHSIQPYAIYTYGNNSLCDFLNKIFNVRKRWIHLNTLPEELCIVNNVFSSCLHHQYDDDHPLISVITSTFHSKEKIFRPFHSLQNQTYTNWEWVIWDDSKDNMTYENLLSIQKTDLRIRIYKAPTHSGSIGEMKRLACGVSYGSLIVELDHDDDLHPELFQWLIDASKKHSEADFFYCDTAMIHEKSLTSHSYDEFFGYGYCSHINVWSDFYNKWITQLINAKPNPVTLQHLVGLPNHVRVWRTAFYDKIGKHNPRLSVSDDYELLVKSFIHGKWCHITSCGYFQYLNEDGNFTFIRNSLIQHNVNHIYNHYKESLPEIPNDYKYEPYWKYDGNKFPNVNINYNPYPHDYSIIIVNPTKDKVEKLMNLNNFSLHVYMLNDYEGLDDHPPTWKRKISWWKIKNPEYFVNEDEKMRYLSKIATGNEIITDIDFFQKYLHISHISHIFELKSVNNKIDSFNVTYDELK